MDDNKLDKAIKGLECAIGIRGRKNCDDCPYDNDFNCLGCDIVMRDALELLKELEAKPMIENERGWNCPSCGMKLIGKTASGYPCNLIDFPLNFCPRCGQEVKWE